MPDNVVHIFSKRPVETDQPPVATGFVRNDKVDDLIALSQYDIIRTFLSNLFKSELYATIPNAYKDILSPWVNHTPEGHEETIFFGTEYREKLVPDFGIKKNLSFMWLTIDYCDEFNGDWDHVVSLEEMTTKLSQYRMSFPMFHSPFVRLWDATLKTMVDLQTQSQIVLQKPIVDGGLFGFSFYLPTKTSAGWIRAMIIFDFLPLILDEQARQFSLQNIKYRL